MLGNFYIPHFIVFILSGLFFAYTNACATTIGASIGPQDLFMLFLWMLTALWQYVIALVLANVAISVFIIFLIQRSHKTRIPSPVRFAFIITLLSIPLGPIAGIPGLICTHYVHRKYKNIPESGLISASFVIGYLLLIFFFLIEATTLFPPP